MKQKSIKNIWNIKLPLPLIMAVAVVLCMATLFVVPSVLARFTSVAQGDAVARIAAFDVDVVALGGFGDDHLLYFHKAHNPGDGPSYFIEATNNSEVTVRVRLRFYNVLQNNGSITVPTNFQWWNNAHRREFPMNTNMLNAGTPATARTTDATPHPRIGRIRTANTAGVMFAPSDRQFYAAGALGTIHEGAVMQPGETIRFYFNILPELNGPNNINNIRNHDDFSGNRRNNDIGGDGRYDAVFRINFDLVATQVN